MANNFNIGSQWKLLSGQTHWEGLLSPLDADLQRYIIRYGRMAQATYDSFNKENTSELAGDCRHKIEDFYSKEGLGADNPYQYRVTKYLYATSEVSRCLLIRLISCCLPRESSPKETNWMGYVAVATDDATKILGRRDIVIAWRGTQRPSELLNDFAFLPMLVADWLGDHAMVHGGFYSVYTSTNPKSSYGRSSVRDQVLDEVRKLVNDYRREDISITVTGHSLGAALAILNTVDIVANKYNIPTNESTDNIPTNESTDKACLVTAMAFASPRVGDRNFKETYSKYEQLRCLRIRKNLDIITALPLPIRFDHVGEVLEIDTKCGHNLEGYLDGVRG